MTAATKNKQNQDYGFRDLAPTDPRARVGKASVNAETYPQKSLSKVSFCCGGLGLLPNTLLAAVVEL